MVEEAFGYLEEISEDSSVYVEALLVKADLYQAEGLSDVAREKLLEVSHLSDEPIILFGLAELDMELELLMRLFPTMPSWIIVRSTN